MDDLGGEICLLEREAFIGVNMAVLSINLFEIIQNTFCFVNLFCIMQELSSAGWVGLGAALFLATFGIVSPVLLLVYAAAFVTG